MQSMDADLGFLLTELSEDPKALLALVIDEIERSLPTIISSLKIPPPIEKHRIQISIKRPVGITADQAEGTRVLPGPVFPSVSTTDTRFFELPSRLEEEQIDGMVIPVTSNALQGNLPFEMSDPLLARTVRQYEEPPEPALEIPDIPIELQEPLANRDIRGLIALLKGGRLVAFIDVALEKLIPGDVEKIRVPSKKTYAALNLDNLIAAYHELAVTEKATPDLSIELQLLDALIGSIENEEQWARINTRRFHLINKKHSIGLGSEELQELNALDALAEKQMHAVQQLPFAELAMLKTYTRRLGFEEPA